MTPEDVERLHDETLGEVGPLFEEMEPEEQAAALAFASALETHVRAETVAMCKEKAAAFIARSEFKADPMYADIDWSSVDAALTGHVMPGLGDAPQCPRCGATRLGDPCVDAAVKEGGGG